MRETQAVITSVSDLTPHQRACILQCGGDPQDPDHVRGLTVQFREEFGVRVDCQTMRRLATNLQRKERRNGGDKKGGGFHTPPPTVRRPHYIRF